MKTAKEMRKITRRHKYDNSRVTGLIIELNSQIKNAAKDGEYFIRRMTNLYNKEEAEYIRQYYEKLGYVVEYSCVWREIIINWKEKSNE